MAVKRSKRLAQVAAIRVGQDITSAQGNAALSGKPLKKLVEDINRANDATRDAVNEMLTRPLAKVAIKVELEWGLNKLDHGMGEIPFSFHTTTDEPDAVVTDAQARNPHPSRQLWVHLDRVASCNAVIWIY